MGPKSGARDHCGFPPWWRCVLCPPGELFGSEISQRAMRVIGVVIAPPGRSLHTRVQERSEPVRIEQFLSHPVVEGLAKSVVTSDTLRFSAFCDEAPQHPDDLRGFEAVVDLERK